MVIKILRCSVSTFAHMSPTYSAYAPSAHLAHPPGPFQPLPTAAAPPPAGFMCGYRTPSVVPDALVSSWQLLFSGTRTPGGGHRPPAPGRRARPPQAMASDTAPKFNRSFTVYADALFCGI